MILLLNTMKNQNKKDPKFKVGDHVRVSKYKNIFAKGYAPNWSEVIVINKIKNTNALDCVSMKNHECKVRPEIININSNNPMFYLFSIKVNKCSGNCNNIDDPYATVCVPDVIKGLNVRVFNLMSRTNQTRFIEWHEKRKCE